MNVVASGVATWLSWTVTEVMKALTGTPQSAVSRYSLSLCQLSRQPLAFLLAPWSQARARARRLRFGHPDPHRLVSTSRSSSTRSRTWMRSLCISRSGPTSTASPGTTSPWNRFQRLDLACGSAIVAADSVLHNYTIPCGGSGLQDHLNKIAEIKGQFTSQARSA